MENENLNNFNGYRKLVIDVCEDLSRLEDYCGELGLTSGLEMIREVKERVSNQSFSIAIVGEFKRGKSTLINALLGQEVLPTDILPCSATLNRITYGVTPSVKVTFKDGREEAVAIDRLPEYVTKLTSESEQTAANVAEATVFYPVNYCMNNVDIIDTPGLNDDKNMTDVTLSVLPKTDAAIMTIMATSPFSDYERDFLENKLLTSDMGRVLFVVTRIDSYDDEDDVKRVLDSITARIEKYIMEKAEKTYGADSPEFANFKRKIGKPRVFGISAKQAIKGKLSGNAEMLERSRFPVFERELERFLTEERGAVLIQVPLNRITACASEILQAIQMRESAIGMKKEEFEASLQKARAEFEEIRAKKTDEINRLAEASEETFRSLRPLLDNFWTELQSAADAAVYAAAISRDDVKKEHVDATQQRLAAAVSSAIAKRAQELTERVQVEIERKIDVDFGKSREFGSYLQSAIGNVRAAFAPTNAIDTRDAVIGAAINTIGGYGVGGIYMGWKQGGIKGAAVGGVAGFAGLLGGVMTAGAVMGVLGIALAGPAMLVAGVVGIVASTFSSKFVLSKMFTTDQTQKFREAFADAVSAQIAGMKQSGDFARQVHEQVTGAYGALKDSVERETETVIRDTEATLSSLNEQFMTNKVTTEHEKEALAEMAAGCKEMLEGAEELNRRLLPAS
jgi:GTPase SAR1 family protein